MKEHGYAGRRPDKARKGEAWPGSRTPDGYEVHHQKAHGTDKDRWIFVKIARTE